MTINGANFTVTADTLCNDGSVQKYFTGGAPSGWSLGALGSSSPSSLVYDLTIPESAIWVEYGYSGTENGTEAQPYSTLRSALDATTNGAGAHIVVKDATIPVTSSNASDWFINDRASSGFAAINSGSGWATSHTDRANMITVRAETAFGVRFSYTGSGGYYNSAVHLENAEYVSVDGFIFEYDETSGQALLNGVMAGDNNYISRCIVKRAADGQAGSWFSCGDYSLVEMCAGVGATRYGFRSGDSTAATTNHCFRMCIGRQDFSEWSVPNATFAHYGNNSGTGSGNAAFLNCLALDGQWYDTTNANLIRWSSFYLPKNAASIQIKGCVALNEEARYAGLFVGELSGENIAVSDSVVWDITGSANCDGHRCNAGGSGNTADALTIGNVNQNNFYSSNTVTATNSRASDTLNGTDKTILYQSDGADARYLFGSLGQRYGDSGYATKSSTQLFPWPYESEIKTVFAEQLDTPSGHSPASNVSARGFANDTSLTNYLLTYADGTAAIGDLY